jgi:hypothetical protein
LRFVDDVDQLLEQINVRQRVSRFDEVLIVSLVPGTQTAGRRLTPRAEICIHRHSGCCVGQAGFARDPA